MAGQTDVSRLVLQVDASVELARRNLRDLATAVERESASMETSLGRVDRGTQRMGKSLASIGQQRAGMQQLSFQIGDVAQQMALGTRASIIFAQQSGQVIQAFQLMGGSGNGFLKFLSGPWGIALSSATVILSAFAGKLFEGGNEIDRMVEKMREQARQAGLNRQADEAWKRTIEGVTEAIRARREEQEKSLRTDVQAEQDSLAKAKGELVTVQQNLRSARARLPGAEDELAAAKGAYASVAGTHIEGPQQVALAQAQQKVDQLKREIAQLQQAITIGEANIRGATIAISDRRVEGRLDAVVAATNSYTEALGRLRDERTKGLISQAEYEKRLEAEKKTLKAAEDAARSSSSNRESGRQVSGTEAAAIARNAGLQVNSVNRPSYIRDETPGGGSSQERLFNAWVAAGRPKDNPVAPPGSSAHEGAKGKWAIDIQITDGVTPASIRKLYADKGVSLSKVLKERGHLHIEGSRSEAAAAEKAADRATELRQDQDDNFKSQSQQLDQQLLAAQMELVTGIEAQAQFASDQIDLEQKRYEQGLQAAVNDDRLREGQAALLVEQSKQVTAAKKANIAQRKSLALQESANRDAQQRSEFMVEGLRFDDEMARTQSEHRRIQLDIIAALYAQREADLKLAKAKAEAAKDFDEAARIQRDIDEIPARRGRDEERTRRGTENPLQEWMDGVPQSADEINQAFMQISAQGLDSLADGLAGVIAGTQSLGDVFRSIAQQIIADIARMIIRMLVMRALMAALGGSGGGAGGAGAGGGFLASTLPGPMSFGGGFGLTGAATGISATIGGRGGTDNNVLSINGRPALKVSRGETLAVIPQMPSVNVPRPANADGAMIGGDTYHVTVEAPNTGNPRRDRQTALQQAGLFQDTIISQRRKGLVTGGRR